MKKQAINESLQRLQIIRSEIDGTLVSAQEKRSGWRTISACIACSVLSVGLTWLMLGQGNMHARDNAAAGAGTEPISGIPKSIAQEPGYLNVSGYVVARDRTTVSAESTGRLVKLFVKEGQEVKAGQILAQLTNVAEATRLELMKSQLRSANVQFNQYKLDNAQRQAAHQRNIDLRSHGMISAAALEQSLAQLQAGQNQVERGRLDIEQAKLSRQLAETAHSNTLVRAPFAGVVLALNAQIGEIVSPLAATGFIRSGICTIADPKSQVAEFDVSEKYLSTVRIGQAVSGTLDAYPDSVLQLHVSAISGEVDRAKGTVRIQASFDGFDSRIRPEMGIRVSLKK